MPEVHPWIVRPCKRPGARVRLFCFPRAGGGVTSFRSWADESHPDMEIALIQPPGRENRLKEAPLSSMPDLVLPIVAAIGTLGDLPFAFYGHSLGAKVAFETARELRRRGLPQPVHMFAAASAGPSVRWNHPVLHLLDDVGLLAEIQKRYSGVPNEVIADPELRSLVVPALRADIRTVETYRYSEDAPLTCPITCFGGVEDEMTPLSEIADWRKQTSASFRLQMFQGGHFFPTEWRETLLDSIASDLRLRPHSLAFAQNS